VSVQSQTTAGRVRGRIDLAAVEASLREVQQGFARINGRLSARREPLGDDVLTNMLAGYAWVDALVAAGVDVFAMGSLRHLLELNATVLCGTDPARRAHYARHTEATERRFYEERGGGIRDVVEWHARHAGESARERAAGVYVRILSRPQLFIEGNHRTAVLIMSVILLEAGEPPFVLSPANAAAFFEPSAAIGELDKASPAMALRSAGIRSRLVELIGASADMRYLKT
jgi:hypothetical protein